MPDELDEKSVENRLPNETPSKCEPQRNIQGQGIASKSQQVNPMGRSGSQTGSAMQLATKGRVGHANGHRCAVSTLSELSPTDEARSI